MSHESNGLKRYLVTLGSALTVAILLQTGALIWWASNISVRMINVEKASDDLGQRVSSIEKAVDRFIASAGTH
ncbi:MAG: hypothetical protein AABZ12_10505 [Planctomycetota bacterium]